MSSFLYFIIFADESPLKNRREFMKSPLKNRRELIESPLKNSFIYL